MPHTGLEATLEYQLTSTVATYTRMDKIEGGSLAHEGGRPQHNPGAGGQDAVFREGVGYVGDVDTALQTGGLLARAKPASIGVLPPVIEHIQGGIVGVTGAARHQEDAYLNVITVRGDVNGLIMVHYEWMALKEVPVVIASMAAKATGGPFPWHGVDVQLPSGARLKCQNWELRMQNGLDFWWDQDTDAAGEQRSPEGIDPGEWQMFLGADFRLPIDQDLSLDAITVVHVIISCSSAATAAVVFGADTTGGNGLHIQDIPVPVPGGADKAIFHIDAESELWDFASWNVSVA